MRTADGSYSSPYDLRLNDWNELSIVVMRFKQNKRDATISAV
jgi:hypothetical protein